MDSANAFTRFLFIFKLFDTHFYREHLQAMFGDVNTNQTSVLPQAESYVHRFGPGLVLYWFGHAPKERLDDSHGDVSIISWEVPKEMLLPTGEIARQDNQIRK